MAVISHDTPNDFTQVLSDGIGVLTAIMHEQNKCPRLHIIVQ